MLPDYNVHQSLFGHVVVSRESHFHKVFLAPFAPILLNNILRKAKNVPHERNSVPHEKNVPQGRKIFYLKNQNQLPTKFLAVLSLLGLVVVLSEFYTGAGVSTNLK